MPKEIKENKKEERLKELKIHKREPTNGEKARIEGEMASDIAFKKANPKIMNQFKGRYIPRGNA